MNLLILLAIIVLLAIAGVAVLDLTLTILGYLLVGLIVGAIARAVVPNTSGMSLLATSLAGLIGAMVAGLVVEGGGLDSLWGFVLSVVFAAIAVAIYAGTLRSPGRREI